MLPVRLDRVLRLLVAVGQPADPTRWSRHLWSDSRSRALGEALVVELALLAAVVVTSEALVAVVVDLVNSDQDCSSRLVESDHLLSQFTIQSILSFGNSLQVLTFALRPS
mmetsp:Transcript_49870/g.125355  ORF Transcript_49870/g.125355 Transcript_49870/m.125355 type:complete len:110 (-) Transcript_49870:58-387(-)